ncbi:MAG: hypothetical protein IPK76_24380 [Lewinellaceae bacterium]|nr:hypothetical protein [Lewinellaceae bacterium]
MPEQRHDAGQRPVPEVIQIWALAGQTWTLTANQGLYSPNSAAPPAGPTALPVGTQLVMGSADGLDNDGDGQVDEADEMVYYTLKGIHVEGIGYTGNGQELRGPGPDDLEQVLLPHTDLPEP